MRPITIKITAFCNILFLMIVLMFVQGCPPKKEDFLICYNGNSGKDLKIYINGSWYKLYGTYTLNTGPNATSDEYYLSFIIEVENGKEVPMVFEKNKFKLNSDFFSKLVFTSFYNNTTLTDSIRIYPRSNDIVGVGILGKIDTQILKSTTDSLGIINLAVPYFKEPIVLKFNIDYLRWHTIGAEAGF